MPLGNGFTLIEILVVILIIGITLGFAMMAFGDFGKKRQLLIAAEQFEQYIQLVQQQAILETSTLGVYMDKNTYQVLQLSTAGTWQSMPGNRIFRPQHLPKGAIIHLQLLTTTQKKHLIIIQSSGEMTPFRLTFGTSQQAHVITVIGESNGSLHPMAPP